MPGVGALYDRGSLVAVEPSIRLKYIKHTKSLLHKTAYRFIISLDYKEGYVQGPPYSIKISEILSFWPDLKEICSYNDIENSSPKFKKSGLKKLTESVWIA
jgi:thiopurine S-methyltransferase